MRIAVTTPSGNVGRYVVRSLIRAGQVPIVLARDPGKLDPALADLIETRRIDQFDAALTVEATRGVDALFWVDPTAGGEDPLADYAAATASVVAAVEANQIRRVVFQSSIGAEKRHGAGEIDSLARTEVALNATAADVTHLRCGYFFTNLLFELAALKSGGLQVVLPLDQPLAWVAPADIAEVAAGLLLSDAWHGKRVQAVHGPADLTWTEVAEIVSAAIDRPITVERISDDQQRKQLLAAGMSENLADAVLGMSTGLRDDFTPEQPRTPASTTPSALAAWCYAELRPLMTP
ncbi:NAD(P)H-binding protein [Kribbella sp. NPDC051587]|uniref:NmrA family NAD(P)-binding protein n=1 Tax=Kribbella sp. NPDC051587 TaxID=3364119 RepID=UPI00379E10FF